MFNAKLMERFSQLRNYARRLNRDVAKGTITESEFDQLLSPATISQIIVELPARDTVDVDAEELAELES